MPWQHCSVQILDNQRCPRCGSSKPAWTLRYDVTRRFVIGGKSDDDQALVLRAAAERGVPFCEKCEAARRGKAKQAVPTAVVPWTVRVVQAEQARTLRQAAGKGAPFCEKCEAARREAAPRPAPAAQHPPPTAPAVNQASKRAVEAAQTQTLRSAAEKGAPFCEKCEAARSSAAEERR